MPPVQRAVEAQRQWSKSLPELYNGVQEGKGAVTAARARALGKTYGPVFKQCHEIVGRITPPASAVRYHEYLLRWLKSLINASDTLIHAPEDGRDVAYLRDCHDFLDDARYAVKPLTEIRTRLYEIARGQPPKAAT